MKIKNMSLPYPVLGNQDDVLPLLPEDCIQMLDPVLEDDYYVFKIYLRHDNEEISELIEQGFAEYTCEVSCSATYLRRCERPKDDPTFPGIEVRLHRKEVYKTITFNCYVTVKNEIIGYHLKGFNPDYGNATFDMKPGYALVVFPELKYVTDLKYDMLYAVGTFLTVKEAQGERADKTWFDLSGEKIVVNLPHAQYEQFKELHRDKDYNEIFHASIVFNALTYALAKYNETSHGDKLWAEAIKYRINHEDDLLRFRESNFNEEAYDLAEALLKDPYKRLFDYINKKKS